MGMLEQVVRGRTPMPPRIMAYGTHGIGKSTLGASAPEPIFIQTEDGLNEIDCARFPLARSVEDVLAAMGALYTEEHSFQTVVVDTLDWLEQLIWQQVCKEHGVKSIDAIGYGKGYRFALTHWRTVLEGLNALRNERGMMVLLLAHSKVEKFENPETDNYDRYEPRLHKDAAALVQEWCDAVLFLNYRVFTKASEEAFGRKAVKALGTGERIIRTTERPYCLAKNRYGMPEELPLSWEAIAACLAGPAQTGTEETEAKEEA